MQIWLTKHVRKIYACRDGEAAPVTVDNPAQLIEKSLASPSVQARLLTTQCVDDLPLYGIESAPSRHSIGHDLKNSTDVQRLTGRQQNSLPILRSAEALAG